MRKVFTSKQQRKQAEDKIIREMRQILSDLDEHRRNEKDKTDKQHVMAVLTQFVRLKKSSRI